MGKKRKFNIVYKTINTINQKIYIGVHKTDNLNDGYIGHGIRSEATAKMIAKKCKSSLFPKAVKKYGYSSFKRETLFNFDTYEEALNKEKEIVDAEFLRRCDVYNLMKGGSGGDTFSKLNKERQDSIREMSRERSLNNDNTKKTQFQNRTKKERRVSQDKVNKKVRSREHFNLGLKRTEGQLINNARSRSRFIYIDAGGREFDTAMEAGLANGITHKNAELRSRRGNCGWSRKNKE